MKNRSKGVRGKARCATHSVDVVAKPAKGGGINIEITCETCDKPIVTSDKYGMYCKDLHGRKEAIKAYREINEMIKQSLKIK
jgi:hypothetical protein